MASRNYAQVAPTAATIALNAYIFGYGGHSLVTPHAALKQLWWTNERIDAKVTRPFVASKLRGEEREFLNRPLAFGEGLTDDTYMEWILERAKRFFLILTEIGVPDQIFGCIDDSWDDDDLPIPLENVQNLELSYENNEALNQKFYDMQFVYLLRELKQNSHVDYGPKEHIPMEHVNVLPPAVCLQPYDRVHFPGKPEDVFMRRKFAMTDKETGAYHGETFMRDVKKAKALSHEHIATTWASYTSEDAGFVLSDFVAEHTLGTFIEHRTSMQFLRVNASERPILLMEWMHCLADALASLHHRGVAHGQIRPSNIWINKQNKIAFADVGTLATFQKNKKAPKTEAYDYAAPEQSITRIPVTVKSSPPPVSSMSAFSKLRKMSMHSVSDTSSSTSGSSGASSTRSNSFCVSSPVTPPSSGRSNSLSTIRTTLSPSSGPQSPRSIRNFSRHLPITCPSPTIPTGPFSSTCMITDNMLMPRPTIIDPDTLCALPAATPEMSDMFSLACVFLDVLTFMLRGKITDFVKFRSTRIPIPGKNKVRNDSSFHSEPDKIAEWIGTLEEDSYRHGEPIFRGVPEMLRLVRMMMMQNATLRPTAVEVRDRIYAVLLDECSIETLCCAGREWAEIQSDDKDDGSMKSPFRRDRDELSIATGILGMPPRKGSDAARCASSCGGAGADRMSILSRAESSVTVKTRRRSSASTATARLSSWRSRFMRSP
ncbi:hypothetical protein CLAFUW4_04915 [Fulvia fulva]|uniref:Protein kinase domain-containing protein n=1 Tax=Passalora fulva TaxID=5499 RepID=A0A9Q8PI82_PASFU|nr:uncharacterized protein CLAFUR5_11990 [Fulvia fulva]KAK4627166.1 hypothetical protein CLAFUR4_04901 [Fulvia fulva]KAK4627976.1 hypothetical protein CLAFUR0_04905 [Fulvia fulva]UJO22906.1 hypothetical protein CLAFUR5_11990 [Fulvia fulva]WPV14229.1 hypothetical protein CLAFUW4_04915 [Fulvia fulva]WPV28302.1 hypothetical protein CLAFUW7_04909 [Fulvia fulva]